MTPARMVSAKRAKRLTGIPGFGEDLPVASMVLISVSPLAFEALC
ncbi:hypothetical protein PJL18_03987 [Paenarthrobacter nicotinovorans]|nr:hypothetical protein [Paenarthrobacter nicotinovorans]